MPVQRGRRNLRLPGRDYSAEGAYFVTLCTQDRRDLFGQVVDGAMRLSDFGQIIAEKWQWLATRYRHVTLDEWCVMPDHLHGILILTGDDGGATTGGVVPVTQDAAGPAMRKRKSVGRLVGAFKTVSTKAVNDLRRTPGALLWQRDFWERVIRNEVEMAAIRRYIRDNPIGICRGGS